MMRISWVGEPSDEDARSTMIAWEKHRPDDIQLIRQVDPSANVIVFHNPEAMSWTEASLVMRERFGRKAVFCVHGYLDFENPAVAKRAQHVCESTGLLLFWSSAHDAAFRLVYPGVETPGRWVPIIAEADYLRKKKRRRRKKKESPYFTEPYEMVLDKRKYNRALKESAARFWAVISAFAARN